MVNVAVSTRRANTVRQPVDEDVARDMNFRYRWLILIGLVISAILEVMDSSILNVALPQMAGSLGATLTDIAWVSTAYLLANVVVLPMTAWFSKRLGRKTYLMASIIIFSVSRLLCAFSPSLGLIVVWRLIQGGAGAALISTAQAVLVDIFPKRQQGAVQALFGLGLVVAPAVAPLLGGWIVDTYNWQWLFYIHLPVAVLSLLLVGRLFSDTSTPESRSAAGKLDGWGVGLLAVGLGSLQYVLEEGQQYDWFSDVGIVSFTIIALCGVIALIVWELHPANKSPIVNFRIYANPSLAAAVVISFVAGVGIYGVNFAFSVLVQDVLHYTPIKSGLALIPIGFGSAASLIVVALLANKIDARVLIVCALVIGGIGAWMLGFNTPYTDIPDTALPRGLVGFGTGGTIMPVSIAAFAALRPSEAGDGAAQLGLGRQLGGSFGIAMLNTFVTHMAAVNRASLVEHCTTANPDFMQRWTGLAGALTMHGYSWVDAQARALSLIDQAVMAQSYLKAYNTAFQLVAMVLFACILLVLLLKSSKPNAGASVSVH